MDKQRYWALQIGRAELTQEERDQGWHFCPDWDYLLVGPGTWEQECCTCDARRLEDI